MGQLYLVPPPHVRGVSVSASKYSGVSFRVRSACPTKGSTQMNLFLNTIKKVLGAAAVTAIFATGAYAGDLYGAGPGGYKDGAGGIPVPAPIPVPDYTARYYFRMDAAYGWNDASAFSNTLYPDAYRFDDGFSEFGRYGIGMGIYLNSYLRADATFDMRNEVEGFADTTFPRAGDNGTTWGETVRDRILARDSTMLFNGYVDIPVSARFRPYIGAGVGVAVHRLQRTLTDDVTCSDDNGGADCNDSQLGVQSTSSTIRSVSAEDKDWTFGFAGALMAGAVYDISDNWKFDFGYRFLHLSSVDFSQRISGTINGANTTAIDTVTIPDQNIHELRIGLRYDIQ